MAEHAWQHGATGGRSASTVAAVSVVDDAELARQGVREVLGVLGRAAERLRGTPEGAVLRYLTDQEHRP